LEIRKTIHDLLESSHQLSLHELGTPILRTKRHAQHADRLRRHMVDVRDRTRALVGWIKPRPFALGRVEVETQRRSARHKNTPHLLEKGGRSNNSTVVHVPLVIDGR
jgi:hypothetical protein